MGVGAPAIVLERAVPVDQLVRKSVQAQVEVLGLASFGRGAVDFASWVDEPTGSLGFTGLGLVSAVRVFLLGLERIQDGATGVALVSSGALVVTDGALALDETIRKEALVSLYGTEGLNRLILLNVTIFVELSEDVLHNIGLMHGRGLVKDVELDAEPVVDGLVQGVVLGAESRRVDAFFESFCFGRGAVLILNAPRR